MAKAAYIYILANGKTIVFPAHAVRPAVRRLGMPKEITNLEIIDDTELAQGVKEVLDISESEYESLLDDRAHDRQIFRLAGVKSWKEFNAGTKLVQIVQSGENFVITPFRFNVLDRKSGFQGMQKFNIEIPEKDHLELSKSIRAAFLLAE